MKYILYSALAILAADLVGFVAWVASGQTPADGFYIGAITGNIIKLFL
jgi:hypothetical protein